MKKFHLELGEPVVVTQGEVGDQAWGHYNFPSLRRAGNGSIVASWAYSADDIYYKSAPKEVVTRKASDDNGKTWRLTTPADRVYQHKMKNGKYFCGFKGKGAHAVEYFKNYTPVFTLGSRLMFFAEDIDCAPEDTEVYAIEYDPATEQTETFKVTVNWPYMPISAHDHDKAYPVTQMFALCNCSLLVGQDGDLYLVMYTRGFNSEAKSREEAVTEFTGPSGAYIFKSADCGRTWDYQSQILIDADTMSTASGFEGFTEPKMAQLPDGSFTMLLRTGSNHPCYIAHSTDMCKTWTKPEKFDDLGVLPQILPLECGVTLAAYGRPKLRLRATGDPAAVEWEEPITIPLSAPEGTGAFQTSCFYTNLLPLDDHTALWTYTDFQRPNADGEPARAVLVRTVTVVED